MSFMWNNKHIPFPRGKCRASLARDGLVGKLHITSDMSAVEVLGEVRSLFNPLYPIVHISISPRPYDNNVFRHCFQWLTTQS